MTIEKTETFVEHDIIVDGVKVGTVELCPERLEISRLNIWEPYQNKGYGTEVVKSLVKQGYKSLWVRSDNAHALHIYEKCGFKRGETYMYEMKYESEGVKKDCTTCILDGTDACVSGAKMVEPQESEDKE